MTTSATCTCKTVGEKPTTRIFKATMPGMLSIIFLLIAAIAYSYPTVGLYAERTDFLVGDSFEAQVWACGLTKGDEVTIFGFDVHFVQRGLDFTGAVMAPGFDDVSAIFPETRVAGMAFPSIKISLVDEILLASLGFQCLSPGSFFIGIASDPGDPNEGLIHFTNPYLEDIFAGVTVNVAPVPAPPSLLLLASGLIGLVYCRRRARRES